MDTKTLELYRKIQASPEAKAKLEAAVTLDEKAETMVALGQELAMDTTFDEARSYLESIKDEELSDDELDNITGGTGVTVQGDRMIW